MVDSEVQAGIRCIKTLQAKKHRAMNLLIVDDSELMITKIIELLEDVDCIGSIDSCGTYSDAINKIDRFRPDMVLLDIHLPDKSGLLLLRHIKFVYPGTIVIMVTNLHDDFYKQLCFQLGASDYIDKSNNIETLVELIPKHC